MWVVFGKELSDHFSSARFVVMISLIFMVSLITTYLIGSGIKDELAGQAATASVFLLLFTAEGEFISLTSFVAFFGPLLGLMLGFDAINRERNQGTLAKLLSQPIYRDAVINGKFLAGATVLAIMLTSMMLMISGLGLFILGVVPGGEEIARLAVYLVVSIFYVSFWLGLAILASIWFKSTASSALTSLALWVFFGFFIAFGASLSANTLAPIDNPQDPGQIERNAAIAENVSLISPVVLYDQATSTIMDPFRKTTRGLVLVSTMERRSMERFKGPLPLGQSILVVVPYLTTLLALTVICFGISYLSFMRQEIRSV